MDTTFDPIVTLLLTLIGWLDLLPSHARALLAAGLCVALFRNLEIVVSERESRFAESLRKSMLLALIAFPLFVWLAPWSRLVIYAVELPSSNDLVTFAWSLLSFGWLGGALYFLARLVRAYPAFRRSESKISIDQRLENRLRHWIRRLGLRRQVTLTFTDIGTPRHRWLPNALIELPQAAAHWPSNVQDILILHELCHLKKNHGLWHLIANVCACLCWPLPWVQRMGSRLAENLTLSADELAQSCYRDPMGYGRSLRHVEQRVLTPVNNQDNSTRNQHWAGLNSPAWFLPRDFKRLLALRDEAETRERHEDPYDKVGWKVGQVLLVTFLLLGLTLQPMPSDIEREYELVDRDRFFFAGFHRTMEKLEAELPAEPPRKGTKVTAPQP